MNQKTPRIKLLLISILLIILLVGIFFGNLAYVSSNPGGLDFLAHWQGAKAFISQGVNPYSEQAAELIETEIKEIAPETGGGYRFVLPLFSLILLAPVSFIADFSIARAIWMTFLEGMLLLSGYLISGFLGRKASVWLSLFFMFVLLTNYPAFRAIENGSVVIIGLTAVIIAFHLILKKNDEPAGLLLAFSLIKPDLVFPILLILLVWVFTTRRFPVLIWFLGTFALLIGFSMVLIPSWPLEYLGSVIEYSARNPVRVETWQPTALEIRLVLAKNLAIVVVLVYEWFVSKAKGQRRFVWLSGLLLSVTAWIGWNAILEYTLSIYPAVLIGFGLLSVSRERGFSAGLFTVTILFGFSSWIFSGMLVPGISEAFKLTWLTVVLPLVALAVLYWSRWWVIRTEKFSEDYFNLY